MGSCSLFPWWRWSPTAGADLGDGEVGARPRSMDDHLHSFLLRLLQKSVCDGTSPIHGGGRLNSPATMTGNEEGDNRGFVKDSGASL